MRHDGEGLSISRERMERACAVLALFKGANLLDVEQALSDARMVAAHAVMLPDIRLKSDSGSSTTEELLSGSRPDDPLPLSDSAPTTFSEPC